MRVSMPAPNFTVRVLLEADDQLSKAVAYAKSQIQHMGDVGAREAGRLENAFTVVSSALKRALGIAVFEAGSRLQSFLEGSVKAFAEFEASAVRLASSTAEAGQSVSGLASAFRVVASAAAREMAVSGVEAVSALEALVKAGLSSTDAVNALKSSLILAKLEGEEFGAAASRVVQVMAQFGVEGSRAAYVVDVLVNASRLGIGTANDFAAGLANVGAVARAMGLSLEETTALLVALERRLGSAEEAGTSLSRLLSSLYEIAGKLGVPVRDTGESLRSVGEIMNDVLTRARELGVDFENLQSRLTGVDVRAVRALFTLMQMSESFETLVAQVSKSGSALQAFSDSLATVEGRSAMLRAETDRLQRVVGESFSAIYQMVGPYVLKGFDALATALRGTVAALVGSKFDQIMAHLEARLRILGMITEEEASQLIAWWVEAGDISVAEGLKIAEALGVYDQNIQRLVETALMAGEAVPESMRKLAEETRNRSRESSAALLELTNTLRSAEYALKDLSTASKALSASLDFYDVLTKINEALGVSTVLTEEQAASAKYLAATQSAVNYVSQLLTLQQQALQLYMLGAVDAGNMLTSVMGALASSLSDGVVSQQEFVSLLNVLGVDAGNVAGSLQSLLVKALETTKNAVEENRSSVEAFVNMLNTLNGMTVHTYHYHHQITVSESGGQTTGGGGQSSTGGSGFTGAPGDFWSYQRGSWYTREGLAYLHEGEIVLPRPVAEWFRRGGHVSKTVNVNLYLVSEVGDVAEKVSRELVRRLRAL
ncbi:MAG: phage tail tape measure protein [Candidatus Caldarchaeum sp.]|nr:phage tail tape measure protein [Candidatus Caldarchaeum sp.]